MLGSQIGFQRRPVVLSIAQPCKEGGFESAERVSAGKETQLKRGEQSGDVLRA